MVSGHLKRRLSMAIVNAFVKDRAYFAFDPRLLRGCVRSRVSCRFNEFFVKYWTDPGHVWGVFLLCFLRHGCRAVKAFCEVECANVCSDCMRRVQLTCFFRIELNAISTLLSYIVYLLSILKLVQDLKRLAYIQIKCNIKSKSMVLKILLQK